MKKHLDKGLKFSAVFAHNNQVATGVIKAINEYGLKVPDDISVIGEGNEEIYEYVSPPLTSILLDYHTLGCVAAENLYNLLNDTNGGNPKNILLKPELIERESCAKN